MSDKKAQNPRWSYEKWLDNDPQHALMPPDEYQKEYKQHRQGGRKLITPAKYRKLYNDLMEKPLNAN